jgi:tetratricopeptide (TPR) repeat protein
LALWALAAVVAGVAVYVAIAPERGADATRNPVATPPPTELQRVSASLEALLAQRQFAPARDLALTYVKAHRDDTTVRKLLARAHVGLGEDALAEQAIDQVIRISPTDAQARWTKGLLARKRGADPLPFFDSAARSVLADAALWADYGQELLAAQRPSQAAEYLQKAYRAGLRNHAVLAGLGTLALGEDNSRALELLTQAAVHPQADTRTLTALAQAQRAAGDLEAAAVSLERAMAMEIDPHNQGVLGIALGQVREAQEQWVDAARAYTAASAFDAARCYFIGGKLALAMEQIDIAAQRPDAPPAVLALRQRIENARFGSPVKEP